jgi:hypothetical protein
MNAIIMNSTQNRPVINSLIKSSAIIVALGLSSGMAFAAGTANDTASNYAPSSWSTTPPNLGSGFGAWNIIASPNGGFAGTYLNSGGAVASGGYSWGVYANGNSGANIDLTRAFNTGGGSASLVNQTFSVAFNSSGIGNAGQSAYLSVGSAFSLGYAGGGSDNMLLSVDGGAANAIAVNFAQMAAGINFALTVTGPADSSGEGYSLSISPFAGGSPIYSTSGTFDGSAYNTSSFTLAVNNTSNNQYFNNLSITSVPEPSTLALAGLSGFLTLLALRRRK